ncbi:hypothetical protein OU789_00165 [Halocynthiibacter sp. C4]|uniref:hypothetical protein n=1 Tax=Halocynthiibacter sp. C4 TaxID=2992758 RepID=UPI00237BB778|nr:hypothetical protein [Halocynthiibacter sp. C4]MDE0588333.1 hypothetical protein [Halocynthiibacter sp. C4]
MKQAGYRTGYFGNLYHLNTQEESGQRDYPRFGEQFAVSLKAYEETYGTRGVIRSFASETDATCERPSAHSRCNGKYVRR